MYSALSVVTPSTARLVSAELMARHCRLDGADDGEVLSLYLETAVASAETFLGRALLTQTLRWVLMETPPPSFGAVLPGVMTYPGDWLGFPHVLHRPLVLPRAPVQAVSTVAIGDPSGGPDQVLETTSWVADTALEPARLRLDPAIATWPMRHIAVTFTAGYGTDPASVPAPIRTAVLMTVAWLYENRGDADGEMPAAAERLMWPYRMLFLGGG